MLDNKEGFLFLDKPKGITSHDLVSKYRRILKTKQIGHAGTLDPFATGLMILAVGKATKLLKFLSGLDKTYEATIRLGYSTDTDDYTGKRLSNKASIRVADLSNEVVFEAFSKLTGKIKQIPSKYSAKKIDGQRAYKLSRDGKDFKLDPVEVEIFDFSPISKDIVNKKNFKIDESSASENANGNILEIKAGAHVSSGTYIRALARDLGEILEVGAHLTELKRVQIGRYRLPDSEISINDVKILSVFEVLKDILPFFTIEQKKIDEISFGRVIKIAINKSKIESILGLNSNNNNCLLFDKSKNLIALGIFGNHSKEKSSDNKIIRIEIAPKKVFL
jgi:tRNA pseudouridine55 synthase